jgi:putative transposase
MGTNSASDADSPDTNARIDTKSPAADRSNGTAKTVTSILTGSANACPEQSRFFDLESEEGCDLDGFVSNVTTIAQSRCERCENYADIETVVCDLPIDHLTFAAHDSFAPYGPSCGSRRSPDHTAGAIQPTTDRSRVACSRECERR